MGTDRDRAGDERAERTAARLAALADRLDNTLRTAEALVRARRRVDLDGLETQARDLCAAILELPAEAARPLRLRLMGLLDRTDSLLVALAAA